MVNSSASVVSRVPWLDVGKIYLDIGVAPFVLAKFVSTKALAIANDFINSCLQNVHFPLEGVLSSNCFTVAGIYRAYIFHFFDLAKEYDKVQAELDRNWPR